MELTREEAIRNFREHWASLAITGVDHHEKDDYLKRNGYGEIINSCFLCHYTHQIKPSICNDCPIEWPETYKKYAGPLCMRSHYGEWLHCADPEKRSRLAALIRDLPEKTKKMEETRPTPKYQIGDKVVPINKTAVSVLGNPLIHFDRDPYWERGKEQGYLFIREVLSHEHTLKNGQFVYSCSDTNCGMGNYYCESDLTPYVEPPKNKFKVGDIVKGNDPDRYGITNSDMTKGEVVKAHDDGIIRVKILEHKKGLHIGDSFGVEEKYFDLVVDEPKAEPKSDPQPPFKVGDRVRVKEDLQIGQGKPNIATVVEEMLGYAGKTGVITDINQRGYFRLDSCGDWAWTSEMLDILPINHAPENKTITENSATFIFHGPKTICIIEAAGRKFKGVAKCEPQDEWDDTIGKGWAGIRAMRKLLDATEKELRQI